MFTLHRQFWFYNTVTISDVKLLKNFSSSIGFRDQVDFAYPPIQKTNLHFIHLSIRNLSDLVMQNRTKLIFQDSITLNLTF